MEGVLYAMPRTLFLYFVNRCSVKFEHISQTGLHSSELNEMCHLLFVFNAGLHLIVKKSYIILRSIKY